MADITRTDIGRRMYQLHKEKGVEKAVEKIRESMGPEWKTLSDAEIRMLDRLLGEAWVNFDRTVWEKVPFGRMTKADVEQVLNIGKFIDLEKAPRTEIIRALERVLVSEAQKEK